MEPQVWHTLVVRLWRDGDGLKLRFLASQTGQQPSTWTIATSIESATQKFEQWLRSIDPSDEGLDGGGAPAPRRTTPQQRSSKRGNDAGATDANTGGP